MNQKVIFISDYFSDDVTGGAELHDAVVIDSFKKNNLLHERIRCSRVTPDYVLQNTDKVWFISNFASLSEESKALLYTNCKYILYEHDYKFLDSRNPIYFPNFRAPKKRLVNYNFYKKAKYIICLCNRHKQIFEINFPNFNNIVSIQCSMWTDKQLELFEKIISNRKNKIDTYAVIKSSNPIKKTLETEEFCRKNNIKYDLISSPNYEKFITTLSNYKGLVFMTGHPEPTPRVAIEAKMLDIDFLSQKELIGVSYEEYFSLTGIDMINKVKSIREESIKKLIGWINEI